MLTSSDQVLRERRVLPVTNFPLPNMDALGRERPAAVQLLKALPEARDVKSFKLIIQQLEDHHLGKFDFDVIQTLLTTIEVNSNHGVRSLALKKLPTDVNQRTIFSWIKTIYFYRVREAKRFLKDSENEYLPSEERLNVEAQIELLRWLIREVPINRPALKSFLKKAWLTDYPSGGMELREIMSLVIAQNFSTRSFFYWRLRLDYFEENERGLQAGQILAGLPEMDDQGKLPQRRISLVRQGFSKAMSSPFTRAREAHRQLRPSQLNAEARFVKKQCRLATGKNPAEALKAFEVLKNYTRYRRVRKTLLSLQMQFFKGRESPLSKQASSPPEVIFYYQDVVKDLIWHLGGRHDYAARHVIEHHRRSPNFERILHDMKNCSFPGRQRAFEEILRA